MRSVIGSQWSSSTMNPEMSENWVRRRTICLAAALSKDFRGGRGSQQGENYSSLFENGPRLQPPRFESRVSSGNGTLLFTSRSTYKRVVVVLFERLLLSCWPSSKVIWHEKCVYVQRQRRIDKFRKCLVVKIITSERNSTVARWTAIWRH